MFNYIKKNVSSRLPRASKQRKIKLRQTSSEEQENAGTSSVRLTSIGGGRTGGRTNAADYAGENFAISTKTNPNAMHSCGTTACQPANGYPPRTDGSEWWTQAMKTQ